MKKQKNKLDEMQEQKLLKIEHNGCWLAFWGLFAALFIQLILYGFKDGERIIGEWVVFMCLSLYIVVDCLRQGIWDRRLSPTPKVNFICSMVAGIVSGTLHFLISYHNYQALAGSIASGIFMCFLTFIGCFVVMSLLAACYRKRTARLENEDVESPEEEKNE